MADARNDSGFFVHPTAVVDDGAIIGPGSKVWHFAHVCKGARIGRDVGIGQGCYVAPTAVIGDACRIQNNVSLYDGVVLEEGVFCGPSMVFTNVRNPRAHVSRKSEYAPTRVRRGATLGANCTIVCGVTLGRYCFVGAGSVVLRDVADFALVVGNPAVQIGWMCRCGERLREEPSGGLRCQRCGSRYAVEGTRLLER